MYYNLCTVYKTIVNARIALVTAYAMATQNSHSLALWCAEKQLTLHNRPNLKENKLQQQMTAWCFTSFSQEQDLETTVGTD